MNTPSVIYIYPTDTVWGIGASIYDQAAYLEIARIKKTSTDKPLSVMFNNMAELLQSFYFPPSMSREWLYDFFALETTLGLSVKTARIEIPAWVHGPSDMITIRFNGDDLLQKIPSPFFSTSLNLTGEPPITTFTDAKKFQETYAPNARLLGSNENALSGEASTIVFFNVNEFKIIRAGRNVEEIKKHLLLTGFSCA